MTSFFQKKLLLLDVDHTLIDWTNPITIWQFRREWKQKTTQSNRAASLRGYRSPTEETHVQSLSQQLRLDLWSNNFISYAQTQGWWIGIFSDFPQPSLSSWFQQVHIHHIAIGLDTGCLKPLPDGCYQLMSQLGVCGSQTYLIGDGLRTDSRAIHSVGGHFIPIDTIRNKPLSTLNEWIL